MQDEQGRVEHGLASHGHGRDVIHRLVDTRIGIEIGPELHPHALAPRHDARRLAVAPEVCRAVEGHVLQEVGQSALPGFFEDGAHPLGDVEVGDARFFGVVADVIGQPVLQFSRQERGVLLQRLCGDNERR